MDVQKATDQPEESSDPTFK